ncbi:MAG: (d)CMP kinase [Thermodesulfobacteriota bacterium]
MNRKKIIITLDGPAGSGKSTVAKRLSERLGLDCLDTGAMYRLVAWALREKKQENLSGEPLLRFLRGLDFKIEGHGPEQKVWHLGREIGQEIRKPEISRLASDISRRPEVRAVLAEKQRSLGSGGGIVAEGRDMGTVIFPAAEYKFFLDATLEVRAKRRSQELLEKGQPVSLETVRQEMKERDFQDQQRALAPLRPAKDARIIDTSGMSVEEVVQYIRSRIEEGEKSPERIVSS